MACFRKALPLTLLALAACGPQHRTPQPPPQPAESALARVEDRLLTAPTLRLRYRVLAQGAFTAELGGELLVEGSDIVQLTASGTFGDAPVQLHLHAAEGRMRGGSAQRSFDGPAPDHLGTALVLGLTRMGILHNLARLTGGRAPDHAEGNVQEWVVPREVTWVDATAEAPDSRSGLRFAIEVAGNRTAEATLWLGSDGLPVRRDQTVRFPGGEMNVIEEYEVVSPRGAS